MRRNPVQQTKTDAWHRTRDGVEARPSGPAPNTRPRGNGDRDQREVDLSESKLHRVLGH